jgi:hypothetical protein
LLIFTSLMLGFPLDIQSPTHAFIRELKDNYRNSWPYRIKSAHLDNYPHLDGITKDIGMILGHIRSLKV